MSDQDSLPEVLRSNKNDHLTASAKAVFGVVPFAGSVLAELAGSVIPNQRIDRIAKFAVELDLRLTGVEEEIVKNKWEDDDFLELAEEAVRQAARATSDERRQYLAVLLSSSMTEEHSKDEDRRHLLRVLGEINDVEVIWLASFHELRRIDRPNKFMQRHKDVLEPARGYFGAKAEDRDRATLQASYKDHLVSLGLLKKELKLNKDDVPELEFDKTQFKYRYSLSGLGGMLLKLIGMLPENGAE